MTEQTDAMRNAFHEKYGTKFDGILIPMKESFIEIFGAGWQAALASQPVVPDGWKLVPIEPTDDMEHATFHGGGLCNSSWCSCNAKDIYRSMLAAASAADREAAND